MWFTGGQRYPTSTFREIHILSKNILIADAKPSIEITLQFLMEQQGYNVMTAERGDFALDMIYQYKPDLVLLDTKLPGINGYDLCEIVRLNPYYRKTKIIFLITQETEAEIIINLALGGDAYIKKPISKNKIVALVKELLGNKSKFDIPAISDTMVGITNLWTI